MSVVERNDPVPGSGEVLVAQRFAGLNLADLLQRNGSYPAPVGSPPDIPGLEVAGTVVAVGPGAIRFAIGDRVMGIVGGGGLAGRVLVNERHLCATPDVLDEQQASAVPEAFITAHDALRTQGRLAMGEVLVVHGATGAVGTAAVQIGVAAGCRVLAVTRRPDAAAQLRALGAEVITDDTFSDEVLELTGGTGANLVLELVGAHHFPGNLQATAMNGRIVTVGVGAGARAELPLDILMSRRLTLIGTVLRGRTWEQKATAVRAFEREVIPLLARGRVAPVIDKVIPLEQIHYALDELGRGGRFGKLLLSMEEQ